MHITKSNITEQTPIAVASCGEKNIPETVRKIESKLTADYHYIN